MVGNEETALNALMIAALALLLATHRLPMIPVDLSQLSWQAAVSLAACAGCDPVNELMAP